MKKKRQRALKWRQRDVPSASILKNALLERFPILGGVIMPVCQNCKRTWSWKQTFKKSFTLNHSMICDYCGAKQYVTTRTRKTSSMITFVTLPVIMLMNFFWGPSFIFVLALVVLIPIYLGIYPFFVELSNQEEPLW